MTSNRRSYANPARVRATNVGAAVVLALVVSACAMLPRLDPPEVTGLSIRNVEVRLPTLRVDADLYLRNPNPVDVSIASLDAELQLGGERAGTMRLESPVTLPARGTAPVPLSAVGDAALALTGVGRALSSGRPIEYALRGAVVLTDGRRFPFSRGGRVGAPPRS